MKPVSVMLVDDSAFIRKVVADNLTRDSSIGETLRQGGFLWIGNTERIAQPGAYRLRYAQPFFYRKY